MGGRRLQPDRSPPTLHVKSHPMATLNAICYLRVSTDAQATSGLGIEAQRERTAAYAVSKG